MSTAAKNLRPITAEDAAHDPDPLGFDRSKRTATVHLAFRGVAVDLQLAGDAAGALQLERLITATLAREGWGPAAAEPVSAAQPQRPARPQRAPLPEPLYQPDGTPCCPWHQRPLKEGQFGLYCPSKAEGEQANPKGYCRFTVKD